MTEETSVPQTSTRRRLKGGRRSTKRASLGVALWLKTDRAARVIHAIVAVVALAFVTMQWHFFSEQLGAYGDLAVGMTPEETHYFEGRPAQAFHFGHERVDYVWVFTDPNPMRVGFKRGRVAELACAASMQAGAECPNALGLKIGDSELELYLRLGEPNSSSLADGIKILRYDDVGYHFVLERAEIRAISARAPTYGAFRKGVRFARWLLP